MPSDNTITKETTKFLNAISNMNTSWSHLEITRFTDNDYQNLYFQLTNQIKEGAKSLNDLLVLYANQEINEEDFVNSLNAFRTVLNEFENIIENSTKNSEKSALTASMASAGGSSRKHKQEPATEVSDAKQSKKTPIIDLFNKFFDNILTEYGQKKLKGLNEELDNAKKEFIKEAGTQIESSENKKLINAFNALKNSANATLDEKIRILEDLFGQINHYNRGKAKKNTITSAVPDAPDAHKLSQEVSNQKNVFCSDNLLQNFKKIAQQKEVVNTMENTSEQSNQSIGTELSAY